MAIMLISLLPRYLLKHLLIGLITTMATTTAKTTAAATTARIVAGNVMAEITTKSLDAKNNKIMLTKLISKQINKYKLAMHI